MGNELCNCIEQNRTEKERQLLKEDIDNVRCGNNNNNNNDLNDSCDDRLCPEILISYDAKNNFFYFEDAIIKVQRLFRSYINIKRIEEEYDDTIINEESICKRRKYSIFSMASSILNNPTYHDSSTKGLFILKQKQYEHKGYVTEGNLKEGFGIIKWEDNSKLYCIFKGNKTIGYGKFIDCGGKIFEGEYENNRPCGYGIYNERNEIVYEGLWMNNLLNGYGIETWTDGTFYRGDYVKNSKHGIGTYHWPDGTIYQGEFNEDRMKGYGMLIHSDFRIYEGEVKDGYMHGYGMFIWPDGKRFFGKYCKDIKEGFGVYIWVTQPIQAYAGFWSSGKQHGVGMKLNDNKVKYGIWRNGIKETWLKGDWEMMKYLPKDKHSYYNVLKNGEAYVRNILNSS